MDSDCENFEDLYEDQDAAKHEKLVEKVLSLNKTQHLKKSSRTEPALRISEFNLVKSITGDKGSIQISELTKLLKNRGKITENVKRLQKNSRTLPKPLEKPQANKIRRTVGYEKARLELDRWEATVTSNRVSTDLSFPLNNDTKLDRKESENFASMWRVKSKLAEELEKHEPKVEEIHINAEQEKFPLTLKEMVARRREAAKLRAFQGYKEAKARRQNKIKSKKYHRIQKREKIKKKLKEFEQLQKTNPEEALKKLEEIEKTRIEERFSLRHKSTGKWARNQHIRAKYDKESRQNLAQQLALSRELTQKSTVNDSESDEEEQIEKTPIVLDESNPWVNGIKPGQEVADFFSGYRKFWTEQNQNNSNEKQEEKDDQENKIEKEEPNELAKSPEKQKVMQQKKKTSRKIEKKKTSSALNNSASTTEWQVDVLKNDAVIDEMFDKAENKLQKRMLKNFKKLKTKLDMKSQDKKSKNEEKEEKEKVDLSLPIQKKVPQVDEALTTSNEENSDLDKLKNILVSETKEKDSSNIDPEKYMKVKTTNLSTAIPDILTTEENEEEVDQRAVISEAFEDDDIVDEFNKDKKDEIDKDKPKDINLSLPGWGSWGGTNIKVNKRKKRRFIIKAPKTVPRRDDNKGFLIVNENAQKKIKEHMVSEVPFPFKTVKDFEASMRAPISNTFVPESAYKKLIKPSVTTKMGTVIEPISKDTLLNRNG